MYTSVAIKMSMYMSTWSTCKTKLPALAQHWTCFPRKGMDPPLPQQSESVGSVSHIETILPVKPPHCWAQDG